MSHVRHRHRRRLARGITVFELALSLGFVGVIVSGAVLFLRPNIEADKTDSAMRDALRIREAAVDWQESATIQGCPTVSQLMHEKKLESGARIDDPWGGDFRIECASDEVVVRSPGRDGKLGTPDDIRVPHSRS